MESDRYQQIPTNTNNNTTNNTHTTSSSSRQTREHRTDRHLGHQQLRADVVDQNNDTRQKRTCNKDISSSSKQYHPGGEYPRQSFLHLLTISLVALTLLLPPSAVCFKCYTGVQRYNFDYFTEDPASVSDNLVEDTTALTECPGTQQQGVNKTTSVSHCSTSTYINVTKEVNVSDDMMAHLRAKNLVVTMSCSTDDLCKNVAGTHCFTDGHGIRCCCDTDQCNLPNPLIKNLKPKTRTCLSGVTGMPGNSSQATLDPFTCRKKDLFNATYSHDYLGTLMATTCFSQKMHAAIQPQLGNIKVYGCGLKGSYCIYNTLPDSKGCQKFIDTKGQQNSTICCCTDEMCNSPDYRPSTDPPPRPVGPNPNTNNHNGGGMGTEKVTVIVVCVIIALIVATIAAVLYRKYYKGARARNLKNVTYDRFDDAFAY